MREFIKRKMYEILKNFKQNLKKEQKYCQLKTFRFDGENIPDYNELIIQEYYLLRYLPAYTTEYYLIYSELLEKNFLNNINVISLGAGCGMDSWGLNFAIQDISYELPVAYMGLDKVKWEYRDNLNIDNYNFLTQDLTAIDKFMGKNYNVIMFPKSIGEFDSCTFDNLKNIFINTEFISDKLVLISSVRKKRDIIDIDRLETIADILEKSQRYKCLDNKRVYTYYPKNNMDEYYKLEDICDKYIYPKDIENFLINLNQNCEGYIENGYNQCDDDCEIMNHYPIKRCSQIEYQILRFKREDSK